METPADCNCIYPPNPLAEEEVKLDITWIADAKRVESSIKSDASRSTSAGLGLFTARPAAQEVLGLMRAFRSAPLLLRSLPLRPLGKRRSRLMSFEV